MDLHTQSLLGHIGKNAAAHSCLTLRQSSSVENNKSVLGFLFQKRVKTEDESKHVSDQTVCF